MFQLKWIFDTVDKKYKPWLYLGLVLSFLTSLMMLINPKFSARLVDEVIVAQNPKPLIGILAMMFCAEQLRQSLRYFMAMSLEYASQSSLNHLRTYLYDKLQYLDADFFRHNRTGDIMTRMSPDLDMCRHFIAYLTYTTMDSITLFAATLFLFFSTNWKLTLCLLALLPALLLVTGFYSKRVGPKFIQARDKQANMNTAAQENISGNRVVKAFAREEYEKDRFEACNIEFRDINMDINRTWLRFYPVIEGVASFLGITTISLGAIFVILGEITAGEMTSFTGMSWALANPMRNLGTMINDLQRFGTSANKIMEIYYANSNIKDAEDAVDHEKMIGNIEFRNVGFSYDGHEIVKDLNFKLEPGKTLAIMGPTGCGKTTVINLLGRFLDAKEGAVYVDGCDVRKWKLEQLRRGIGCATQDVFLFSDTVEGNIAFGNTALTEEEVYDFARRAGADAFIRKLPEGYDTIIGERGVGLSGGQKQRIALARALAVRPAILVLDDTTSALDMETEFYIQQQLRELPFECAKIIIGQRISSVRDADEIIILEEGRITERGTHDELIRNRGYYYDTYCLQQGITDAEGGEA